MVYTYPIYKRNDVATALKLSKEAKLDKKYLKLKYDEVIDNKETSTQGFIKSDKVVTSDGSTKTNVTICFKGSHELQDWINDAEAQHLVIPYGNFASEIRVHAGFLKCYKSVRNQILAYLAKNKHDIYKITVDGHSLGGALATLCAIDVAYNFPLIRLCVYTSGSPKVGNKAFAISYNKRVPYTTRTYVRSDVVPKLPPTWLLKKISGGYCHVGTEYAIGPNGFFNGLKYFFSTNKTNFAAKLANHDIDLYLEFC